METKQFTHLAELYGFRCYYNEDTQEIKGTNWFNDMMIDIFLWIASNTTINTTNVFEQEGFSVTIIKEL